MPGVGNVGYFHKTFFGENGEAFKENRPEDTKHRTSLGKSTDVCLKEVRCFCFPEAPFLKFPRYQEDRNTVFFFLLRESQTSLNSEEK